ncbi:MAG: hypothetical protein QW334_03845 [Thermofilum sp.]
MNPSRLLGHENNGAEFTIRAPVESGTENPNISSTVLPHDLKVLGQSSEIDEYEAEVVWSVFEDAASYMSRLEPHALSFEVMPPGPVSVGQKIRVVVAAGRRKVEVN